MARIRPIAICLFRHNGRLLAAEGFDPVKGERFYRPLGGAIEFGEYAAETLAREIQEELGAAVTNVRYLATLENIFTYAGETGHEIVFVYDGEFVDRVLYEQQELEGVEDGLGPFRAQWLPISDLEAESAPPIYPDGLLALIRELKSVN